MTSISMVKDQKIDITKDAPGLTKVTVAAGWAKNRGTSANFDLDLFAIPLKNGKANVSTGGFVYFANKVLPGLQLDKDNRTGDGDGDDENIFVTFSEIPADQDAVLVGLNMYEAKKNAQHFGVVKDAYVRIYDPATGNEICKYDLSEDYGGKTAIILGRLYRHNNEWKFEAMGEGMQGELPEIVARYA